MRIRALFVAGLAGLLGLTAAAQEPKPAEVVPGTFRAHLVTDGRFPPKKDKDGKEEGPDARNRTGKLHCLVCENGLVPVVAVFVRADPDRLGVDSGVARLAKAMDGLIREYRSDKLAGFVMFLRLEAGTKVVTVKTRQADGTEVETKIEQDKEYPDDENRAKHVDAIEKFAAALAVPNVPFGLAAETSKVITGWGIQDADEVTVVFYNRMRVVERWRFARDADLTDDQIARIRTAVVNTLTVKK
jgi:hypothetical protein